MQSLLFVFQTQQLGPETLKYEMVKAQSQTTRVSGNSLSALHKLPLPFKNQEKKEKENKVEEKEGTRVNTMCLNSKCIVIDVKASLLVLIFE